MRFFLASSFANARGWYWLPTWLNCITWSKGHSKVYRWLFFGWSIGGSI